jgi:hypothetical protein
MQPETAKPLLYITAQASRGKRLKTKASQRVVPIHAQLVRLGFLKFVDDVRKRDGEKAFLFPLVAPSRGRAGVSAWSKWFGRYLRAQGVSDSAKVFHSFRHAFKDALRRGGVNQEIHDALTGRAQNSTVSGGYGAKEMLARFGVKVLKAGRERAPTASAAETMGRAVQGASPHLGRPNARRELGDGLHDGGPNAGSQHPELSRP